MATRNDGLPADQMERAKALAQALFDTTFKNIKPRPVAYVRGEDVPFMNYEVDSPEFWGGLLHTISNSYEKSPMNLGMARQMLNPDAFGFCSQDDVCHYWSTFLDKPKIIDVKIQKRTFTQRHSHRDRHRERYIPSTYIIQTQTNITIYKYLLYQQQQQ